MLKDITLGQYFPGDSLIHKLDPRTKLIAVVLYIVALFQAKGWIGYGAVTLATLILMAISHISFGNTPSATSSRVSSPCSSSSCSRPC